MVLSSEATSQLRRQSGSRAQDGALTDAVVKKLFTSPNGSSLEVTIDVVNITPGLATTIRLFLVPETEVRADTHAIAWDTVVPKIPLKFGSYHLSEGDEIWARADDGSTNVTGLVVTITGTEATFT